MVILRVLFFSSSMPDRCQIFEVGPINRSFTANQNRTLGVFRARWALCHSEQQGEGISGEGHAWGGAYLGGGGWCGDAGFGTPAFRGGVPGVNHDASHPAIPI